MAVSLEEWLQITTKLILPYSRDTKVCVVSVIGKSSGLSTGCKADVINSVVDADVFGRRIGEFPEEDGSDVGSAKPGACRIEAYFDIKSSSIFLHLLCPMDTDCLSRLCEQQLMVDPEEEPKNFFEFWEPLEASIVRYTLFLFHISHIVLLVQPTSKFDIRYVRYLQNLDTMRIKLLPSVSDRLRRLSSSFSKSWVANGRPCSPRLLFAFHRPPVRAGNDKRMNPVRKLEDAIENQIYTIFRQSRVVTNTAANSLCSVPTNGPFVYVFSPEEEVPSEQEWLLDYMRNCKNHDPATKRIREWDDEMAYPGFYEFLIQHIDLAHTKGFDDNIGRNPAPMLFELPRMKMFVKAAQDLMKFFCEPEDGSLLSKMINDLFNVELNFSQSRCGKVLPVAISSYQDGLPSYYTSVQHQARLAQALQILSVQARGPALDKSSRKLIEECEKYWLNGRQACEVLSLLGLNCVNKLHCTPENPVEGLPILVHTSKMRYVSTCNCGHRQAAREDPFELRVANYGFYMETEEFSCCYAAERIEFPIFRPSTDESTAAEYLEEAMKLMTISQEEDTRDHNTRSNDYLPDIANKLLLRHRRKSDAVGAPNTFGSGDEEEPEGRETGDVITGEGMMSSVVIGGVMTHDSQLSQPDPSMASGIDPVLMGAKGTGGDETDEKEIEEKEKMEAADGSDLLKTNSQVWEMCTPDMAGASAGSMENPAPSSQDYPERSQSLERDKGNSLENPQLESNDTAEVEGGLEPQQQVEEPSLHPALARTLSTEEESSGTPDVTPKLDRKPKVQLEENVAASEDLNQTITSSTVIGEPKVSEFRNQASTVEYLPGMLHLASPPGLLPRFPSWSLVCVGPSSMYSHAHGLREQPNFSHGSAFLLAWDAPLTVELERWHGIMESLVSSRRPGVPSRTTKKLRAKRGEEGRVSVKIFVGFEYECPRGHRFMLQNPIKMLKHAGPGGPKESAVSILRHDMPIWFPCSCRASKPPLSGQLMRIHIVTPKAPVMVTINPRVQPHPPHSPTFFPGNTSPVQIRPAEYWILRLPFIYLGDHGPYLAPNKDNGAPFGRFLKDLLAVEPDM